MRLINNNVVFFINIFVLLYNDFSGSYSEFAVSSFANLREMSTCVA